MSAPPARWRVIPRPLMETVLGNYAAHHRVPNPLLLHGPRGSGKTTLILHRLLDNWTRGPHATAYVDFAAGLGSVPWTSWPSGAPMRPMRDALESELERLVLQGIRLGAVGSGDIFTALARSHALHHALRLVSPAPPHGRDPSPSALWSRAVFSAVSGVGPAGTAAAEMLGGSIAGEEAGTREGAAALGVAREVVRLHGEWRKRAVEELNRTGKFSRPLAHSATDWPCLLLHVLSQAAELGLFQPKLVLNNIDVLRKATLGDDSLVPAAVYHDSFIWRLIALSVNERSLPIILVTSDSYYSYQAFVDFGFPHVFLSRESFGWKPQEAKLHMVSDYFTESEWKVIDEVLGPNPRQLSELYILKQSMHYQQSMHDSSTFEDLVDAYLAFLQVTVVNPAMDTALSMLQQFVSDAQDGKVPAERFQFGAPWRHPPHKKDLSISFKWARIQLVDFVQSFIHAEFGLNYLAEESLEIFDDPSALALLEVGLLYKQRDPSFIRPITCGIQRCLVRWLVNEKMQMSLGEGVSYLWHRIFRGRSYRHLMKEIGYK